MASDNVWYGKVPTFNWFAFVYLFVYVGKTGISEKLRLAIIIVNDSDANL